LVDILTDSVFSCYFHGVLLVTIRADIILMSTPGETKKNLSAPLVRTARLDIRLHHKGYDSTETLCRTNGFSYCVISRYAHCVFSAITGSINDKRVDVVTMEISVIR